MRKKSILLLLFLPFVIAIFAFVTSSVFIRSVETDITGIRWDYSTGDNPFALSQKRALLQAEPIYDERYPLSPKNNLVWTCADPETKGQSAIAHIQSEGEDSYLVFDHEGKVTVTCSNEKGNVSSSFTAWIVGDGGAIVVHPDVPFSSQSITGVRHVGLYDSASAYMQKRPDATIGFDLEIFGTTSFSERDIQVQSSDNVSVDLNSGRITLTETGEASITFVNPVSSSGNGTFLFTIEDAMNVYDYDGLMAATNQSETGIPVVLRKNIVNFSRAFVTDSTGNAVAASDDVSLFGRRDGNTFRPFEASDLYSFESTYDHTYLDLWNERKPDTPVSVDRFAAVHIQKDFYGNGFEINLHDLCYPYDEQTITDSLGNTTTNAILAKGNLYRGPLVYVSLGDPNTPGTTVTSGGIPIFALYGQDNVGFYVEGDGILLDDVHFADCDNFASNLTNLAYTGTVLEIDGDDVTIQNSVIEKGRNVLRSYSNKNLTVDNCLLQNSMEFLFKTGSNEFNEVDPDKEVVYTNGNGVPFKTTAKDYLRSKALWELEQKDYSADSLLSYGAIHGTQANEFVGIDSGTYSKQDYVNALPTIADALTNTAGFTDGDGNKVYKGTTVINDTFFYNSGISAIELDTIAQGSYLYSNITSLLSFIVGQYFGDVQPSGMCRTSYPVQVSIGGDTRFYDWKKIDNLSFDSMILQNIATLILSHGGLGDGFQVSVTEDDYLPLRLLIERDHQDVFVDKEGQDYLNIPFFYNGGGYNASDVVLSSDIQGAFSPSFEIDPYVYSLDLTQDPVADFNSSPIAKYQAMKIAMLRAASNITGFHPYRFTALSSTEKRWFDQAPVFQDLQNRN